MTNLVRGAIVEYADNLMGPMPNVVVFQFNPENLTRNIEIPERPSGADSREESQAGDVPVEKITLTAHFTAADLLGDNDPLARTFGVAPQLAALEKMVHPSERPGGVLGGVIDLIGDAISGGNTNPVLPTPREQYPRILFIWGRTRIQPVIIESMRVVEKQYDHLLNPILADVILGLTVMHIGPESTDIVARGAQEYSNLHKDVLVATNLANTIRQVGDIIPF